MQFMLLPAPCLLLPVDMLWLRGCCLFLNAAAAFPCCSCLPLLLVPERWCVQDRQPCAFSLPPYRPLRHPMTGSLWKKPPSPVRTGKRGEGRKAPVIQSTDRCPPVRSEESSQPNPSPSAMRQGGPRLEGWTGAVMGESQVGRNPIGGPPFV